MLSSITREMSNTLEQPEELSLAAAAPTDGRRTHKCQVGAFLYVSLLQANSIRKETNFSRLRERCK